MYPFGEALYLDKMYQQQIRLVFGHPLYILKALSRVFRKPHGQRFHQTSSNSDQDRVSAPVIQSTRGENLRRAQEPDT